MAPLNPERIVLASGNAGKLREMQALLAPLGLELIAQSQLGIAPCEEPHHTFLENALLKARHASAQSGLPALADDSGLCALALGGEPGVRSARFAAGADGVTSDAANNALVVERLRGRDPSAWYVCVLVFLRAPDDPHPLVVDAEWHGSIVAEPRGRHGFGYDPHFWLPERSCTVAELEPEQKNAISHRARAMRALMARLQARVAGAGVAR